MSNSTTIYIYALKDPFTDEIRYIGKSIRPKERLANQCNEHSNTHRCHWIQSILSNGLEPVQIILEELPQYANWQERERYWIAYGRSQGWPLTNGTDGGDGVLNLNADAKSRIGDIWRGKKLSPEHRAKIGIKSKGRAQSEETRKKRSDALKNRYFSPEVRAKISKGNSKLNEDQVALIRLLLSQKVSQYDISKIMGVHQTTISNIKRNLFYKEQS